MRILVFSQAAWNTANSFGNTVTNWFDGWEDTHFFHFYARQQKPNTDIVEKYYNVSAVEILKKAIRGKLAGRAYDASELVDRTSNNKTNTEQEQIAKLHKKSNEILYWGMEQVWRFGRWINKDFDAFVEEADPDIIFAFATSPYILGPAIKHIKEKKPSVKVALWIADDILTGFEQNAWYRRKYLKDGIGYCMNSADKLYGASVEMCEKYSSLYSKEVTPLYKGCTFDRPVKEINNTPLRFVYAGNLLYGRLETLKEIIKVLRAINKESCKAVLEIYSNTPLVEEEKKAWFDNNNAFYMGVRPYEEIKEILNRADIVLHVESFEEESKRYVKYSFSTKIVDCLQSGSVIFGIGPRDIASMEYLENVPGAITVYDNEKILDTLKQIVENPRQLILRAGQSRDFAQKNVDINVIRKKLFKDLHALVEQSGGG